MKKVAAINDLSGFGGCSLVAAISVFSAMGVEVCPLPTAVLSNQTEYESFYMDDYTDKMGFFIEQWKKINPDFDAISIGFIANKKQAELIEEFIHNFKSEKTLLVVDTVMGTGGSRYKTVDDKLCESIRSLAFKADIITPNLTEACILLEKEIRLNVSLQEAMSYAEQLMLKGAKKVIITDVVIDNRIYNIIGENGKVGYVSSENVGGSYSGTGDLFAAVITAGVLKEKYSLKHITKAAAEFIEKSVRDSYNNKTDRNQGVSFQKHLPVLWRRMK